MVDSNKRFVYSTRGSAATHFILLLLTLVIIVAAVRILRRPNEQPVSSIPQLSSQTDTRAFYIAQTALDRSVKALAADPAWRKGFDAVEFEDGVYDVKVFSAGDPRSSSEGIPPNYVRIVASSKVEGVRKEVEGVWVDAMAAFRNTYTAGNEIELRNHDVSNTIVQGNIHNNAWENGSVSIDGGITLYGDVASLGHVRLGSAEPTDRAVLFGSVWGSRIEVSHGGEIREYENLSEWIEGVDLNGDGDTADIGLSTSPTGVSATTSIVAGNRKLRDGDMDMRVGEGSVAVSVGREGVGPIVDPRPDFGAYYQLTTGASSYPPHMNHVVTPIAGDGDGHYFASSIAFVNWLRSSNSVLIFCGRCAGDGHIDPGNTTVCPNCETTGRESAIEVSGVFYIDDDVVDLNELGLNLVVHGTIIVAEGNPHEWPTKTIPIPDNEEIIEHFPTAGRFLIGGGKRMSLTQTYRSASENATYAWRKRTLFSGENAQTIAIPEAEPSDRMRDFPAIIAASDIVIEPRGVGFAYHPGDTGDERLTILQGVLYAENQVRLHGRGGWSGEPLVFDENSLLGDDDSLDEPVLNVDLNGDGDVFDRVDVSEITTVPVIPVSRGKASVDIDNDGMLGLVTIGGDYVGFFNENNYVCPVLIYHEGLVLGQNIHSCDETLVVFDPLIAQAGVPFGFELTFGSGPYDGLVSWQERIPDE